MKFKIVFILFITSFFSTCTYDVYNPDICFQQNILPIFVSKCSTTGCHNANEREAGYDLSNYDGIMKGIKPNHPLLSNCYTVINGRNPSMPVGNKLSNMEVTLIKLWIKMGAQNSSNCSSCDTSAFTYTVIIQPLMNTWCVGCHNASNPGGNYDLSNYDGIKKSVVLGKLLGSIKQSVGYSAMPKGSKLSDCDIAKIEKWVNAGYLNN